ncbi:MAG: cell division protein FtsZ [Bacteroidia bacterium]|nr:cell division protein FtsZ [Bacteroidia bacterium]
MAETENISAPVSQSSIIKVMGVGGGGSNAVNHMFRQGIRDVDFLVCNTDAQALLLSPVPAKVQIGESLTDGRGAGNNPEIGCKAALETEESLRTILSENTKMLFITAGMGGGTGTGAAPVIARIAHELDILTVGIVTIPFRFEGNVRIRQAVAGIEELEKYVDSLLVVNNEKLRSMFGDQRISEAFENADNILTAAAKGIAEIITLPGYVNVDFADVHTVMHKSGVAIMGSANSTGENRAMHAIRKALSSPLLNSNHITGAKNVLLNVTSGTEEFRLDELCEITDFVQSEVEDNVQIIWGHGIDPRLGDNICVTVIATGFEKENVHDVFIEKEKLDSAEIHRLIDKIDLEIISKKSEVAIASDPEDYRKVFPEQITQIPEEEKQESKKAEILEELMTVHLKPEHIFADVQEKKEEVKTESMFSKSHRPKVKKAKEDREKGWIQTTIEGFFTS